MHLTQNKQNNSIDNDSYDGRFCRGNRFGGHYNIIYLPGRRRTATVQQRRNRTRTDDASWSRLIE